MPKVRDVFTEITTTADTVFEDDNLEVVRKKLINNPISRAVYVVNKEQKLVGVVSIEDVLQKIGAKEGLTINNKTNKRVLYNVSSANVLVKDIMRQPVSVTLDDSFREAIQLMLDSDYQELAVVDDEGQVIGDLNAYEVIRDIIVSN